MKTLTKEKMLDALKRLSQLLPIPTTLIVGGGGAMLLAHDFPLATADIDAIPRGITVEELDVYVKKIATEKDLPGDWLNPYFSSFTHVLPDDFETRTISVFEGGKLTVKSLGKEDLLIMKCFAHRRKDIPHARALIRKKADLKIVSKQIEKLETNKTPGTAEAFDFLDEVIALEE